jgi:hypothetical protein
MTNYFDRFDNLRVPEQPAPAPAQGTNYFDKFDNLRSVAPEPTFGTNLTRSQILENPEAMSIIDKGLLIRQGGEDLVGKVGRGVKWLSGGSDTQLMTNATPEEKFEMWQEHMRSLAAGQTVTLGNELAFVASATDEEKEILRQNNQLFESMGNIFTGSDSWAETAEGVGDYLVASVWDPTTLLGLGVGRLYSQAGSQAAKVALKEAIKTGAELATKEAIKGGATKVAAKAAGDLAAKEALKKGTAVIATQAAKRQGLALTGTEFVTSVGKDALYQSGVLMPTGTTSEYSYSQTALAGLGALALPALVYGAKGLAKGVEASAEALSKKYGLTNQFRTYKEVSANAVKMTKDEITQAVKDRIDTGLLNSKFKSSFENFNQYKDTMPSWTKAKEDAAKFLDDGGIDLAATTHQKNFFKQFFFGNVGQDGKAIDSGFVGALQDSGFAYIPRDADDKITNFIGDAISWLDDDIVEAAVKSYEAAAGVNLGVGYDSKSLASVFKLDESLAAQYLNLMSYASKKLGKGAKLKDLAGAASRILDGDDSMDPAYLAYTQSVWKRLLTSHPATTAVNIIGFGQMSLMNSMADVIQAGLSASMGVGHTVARTGKAGAYFRQAKGSFLGSVRRGVNLLNWDATMKEAEDLLEIRPDVAKELFSVISGDSGVRDARKFFNVGTDKWYINSAEKYTTAMQKISGVMLQDEMTKLWGFMGNFDQAIMREYGIPYADFMKKSDWIVEMGTDRFNAKVLGPALERTQRETGSFSWSDKSGRSPALFAAKAIESVSNNSAGGWVIPFGRWFNTATALLSDYSGASFLYNSALKAGKVKGSQNVELLEYAAKGAAGWALAYNMLPEAEERLANGDPWNIRVLSDGTREDITNKFPENAISLAAQMLAHRIKDEEVPDMLIEQGLSTFFTSTFRSTEESLNVLMESLGQVLKGDIALPASNLAGMTTGKILSGATRPLDPINKAIMLYSGDLENPDRRQGAEWLNQSLRYIDQVFPSLTGQANLPERKYATTGGAGRVDVAKTFSGIGTKPQNSVADKMFSSVGSESWREIKWQGDVLVKARMDEIISTLINDQARVILAQYPDFFDKPLDARLRLVDRMKEAARKDAKSLFESGIEENDRALVALDKLSKFSDKRALKKAQEALEVEDLSELVDKPGGAEELEFILDYATTYRDRLID